MVNIPEEIKQTLNSYIFLLKKNNIPIEKMYLYGSFVKGTNKEFSDIDIALISDIFEGIRIIDRKKIREITLSVSSQLEVIPFNPKDFNKDNPFDKEIIETGIQVV